LWKGIVAKEVVGWLIGRGVHGEGLVVAVLSDVGGGAVAVAVVVVVGTVVGSVERAVMSKVEGHFAFSR
jgi:hypothetical protein